MVRVVSEASCGSNQEGETIMPRGMVEKTCEGCGEVRNMISRNRYCSRECAFTHQDKWHVQCRTVKKCRACRKEFFADESTHEIYCSNACAYVSCDNCRDLFYRRKGKRFCCDVCCCQFHSRNYQHMKRAMGNKKIDINQVIEMYDGVCNICMLPVDMDAVWPMPLSPSIDHILPITLGGKHEVNNCQLAHLRCNIQKQNYYPYIHGVGEMKDSETSQLW